MRASIAYFAGVATVVVAIGAGFGGGLLLGDIMNPLGSKKAAATRLDQRAPVPAFTSVAQPMPFMAATQIGATVAGPQTPQQAELQSSSPAKPQSQQAFAPPADAKQSADRNAPEQSAAAPAQPAATSEQPSAAQRAALEDSFAKARDDEGRRDAHRAEDRERRKAERRERREQRAEMRRRQREGDEWNRAAPGTQSWPPFRQPAFGTGRMTLFDDD